MTRAMKLPKAGDFAIPAPFPGKYPTRVRMMVEWERGGEHGIWRYVGKPNAIAAKRFEKEADRGGIRLLAVMEWDRAWMVAKTILGWDQPTRRGQVTSIPLQVVSPWLWTVYHPWHDLRAAATAWMRGGVWVHRIDCALGANARVYGVSPEIGAIYITDYRRRVNVVGQQPQKKKKAAPTQWADYGDMEVRAATAPDFAWPVTPRQVEIAQELHQQAQTPPPTQPQQTATTTWPAMLVLEQERLRRARQQVEQEAPQPRRRHAWMDRWVVE